MPLSMGLTNNEVLALIAYLEQDVNLPVILIAVQSQTGGYSVLWISKVFRPSLSGISPLLGF